MKFEALVKQLANRINQPHVIEHYLKVVWRTAYREAQKEQCNIPIVSNRFDPKYTPPFRLGRKQGKAVLDANGREVIFFKDSEEQARMYCNYLNGC